MSKSGEILVIQSKVKEYAQSKGVRVGGDFAEALSEEVEILVDKAIERAKDNGRQTIRGGDL
jgi:histone H3/H4